MNNKFRVIYDEKTNLQRVQLIQDLGNIYSDIFIKGGTYGGLIDSEDNLGEDDFSWVEDNAIVIDSKIRDKSTISKNAYIEKSIITGNVHITGNAKVYNSKIDGNAYITGNAQIFDCDIKGKVTISGDAVLKGIVVNCDGTIIKDKAYYTPPIVIDKDNIVLDNDYFLSKLNRIYLRFGAPNDNHQYIVYKLVKSTDEDRIYKSGFDSNFTYDLTDSRRLTISENNYDAEKYGLCARGIHVSFDKNFDWMEDKDQYDTMLTCSIYPQDIIAFSEHKNNNKLRVKKIRVRRYDRYPINEEVILPTLNINHSMNTYYLISCVYSNKNYKVFNDYTLRTYNKTIATYEYNIDPNTDSKNNYNMVILAPLTDIDKVIARPEFYKYTFIGDGETDQIDCMHNLNSRNLIPLIYNNNELKEDITKDCIIYYTDLNMAKIKFDRTPIKGELYYILFIKPADPDIKGNGTTTGRGLANATPNYTIKIFTASNISDDGTIVIPHNRNTFDVFGSLYDIDAKEYPTEYKMYRIDENNILIKFEYEYFKNHQFAYFMSWV